MAQGAIGANQTVINSLYPALVPMIKLVHLPDSPPVIDMFRSFGGSGDWKARGRCPIHTKRGYTKISPYLAAPPPVCSLYKGFTFRMWRKYRLILASPPLTPFPVLRGSTARI